MKSSISFVCQECGYDSPKYLGKCPECGMWNSFKEIREAKISGSLQRSKQEDLIKQPKTLNQITFSEKQRISTGFKEADTVLGGGIVVGSVTLLAGDPGVGKSTLLLQFAIALSKEGKKVLYISGEESEEQISLRAGRLANSLKSSSFVSNLLLFSINNTDAIVETVQNIKPDLVVLDSIQTVESENGGGLSGSVGQIRYGASRFVQLAKTLRIPIILVGHVTKEGMVAGPMTLSHMVDTVLFLEGERSLQTRILRSFKNRFGPVDEVGVFIMDEKGMREITNPEHIFLSETDIKAPGSLLAVTLEGTRAFLVEIQALAVYSKLPMPRRVASGVDQRRLELLLAVMQKHIRLPVETMDIFVNVAGGIKLTDRAVDVAICLAIYSSVKNISLYKTVGMGEVGLLGEVRNISAIEKRVKEAKKMGFKKIITPLSHKTLKAVIDYIQKEYV